MILRGLSRSRYDFVGVAWPRAKIPVRRGLYAFAREERNRSLTLLYVGEADDLEDGLADPEILERARMLGMDKLLLRENTRGAADRRKERADLVRFYRPPLNTENCERL